MSIVASENKYKKGIERVKIVEMTKKEIEENLEFIENKKGNILAGIGFFAMDYFMLSSKNLLIEKYQRTQIKLLYRWKVKNIRL